MSSIIGGGGGGGYILNQVVTRTYCKLSSYQLCLSSEIPRSCDIKYNLSVEKELS